MTTYDEMVALGWFKSGNGWLCPQHSPYAAKPSSAESALRASKVAATQQQKKARQKAVVLLVVIALIVVIVVAGIAANGGSNSAYKAGYKVGFNSNNFVSNNQAGSYCQDLWNNLSGSALSKYGSNEGDWVGGCTNGVKAAN